MVLDIYKGVEDMYKANEEDEDTNLEDEVMIALTGQSFDRMKQTGRPITLSVAI
jgi:hypothetical protein